MLLQKSWRHQEALSKEADKPIGALYCMWRVLRTAVRPNRGFVFLCALAPLREEKVFWGLI